MSTVFSVHIFRLTYLYIYIARPRTVEDFWPVQLRAGASDDVYDNNNNIRAAYENLGNVPRLRVFSPAAADMRARNVRRRRVLSCYSIAGVSYIVQLRYDALVGDEQNPKYREIIKTPKKQIAFI